MKITLTTICLVFLCTIIIFAQNAQKINIKDDLYFQDYNKCNWEWLSYKTNCNISLESQSAKNPLFLLKLMYAPTNKLNESVSNINMEFCLFKTIILPQIENRKLDVALTSKNQTASELLFSVFGVDHNENITFNDTIKIKKSTKWATKTISSISKDTKAIYIKIKFNGTSNPSQIVWLKNIKIKIDGKDVNGIKNDIIKADKQLNKNYIFPLSHDEKFDLTDKLPEIKRKKIIGLGENTHGSKTINLARFQFLKNLIERNNCKIVLLEIPFDFASQMDLYVQGKIPENSENLLGYLKLVNDYEQKMDFLKWLRTYNLGVKRKVHIYGIDNAGSEEKSIPLMDYHLELLGTEKGKFYLKNLYEGKIKDVIEFAKKDSIIQQLLGKENFQYYIYLLSDKFNKKVNEMFLNRDSLMFKRVNSLNTQFTTENEKIAILAHSVHIQKIKGFGKEGEYSTLGSFLSEKYDSSFVAIDFCFGSGSFTQDSCSSPVLITNETLNTLPENSFEYAALKTGYDYFYFPSKYLNDRIITTSMITRGSQNQNHFKFVFLKGRFDGYVFLNKSESFDNLKKSPFIYSIGFWDAKIYKFRNIINEYNKIKYKN